MRNLFNSTEKGYIEAPAGCGKTHLIAETVRDSSERYLILTHTHSGVQSLKNKLRSLGVSSRMFHVDTISGFAYRYASAYPKISGMVRDESEYRNISESVLTAAQTFVDSRHGKSVLKASYKGIMVDEYQDCSENQHGLVTAISNTLPCIIFGDPLQAIFGFHERLIDWDTHVRKVFDRIEFKNIPHRWNNVGSHALGEWLLDARLRLISGDSLDINQPFIQRIDPSGDLQSASLQACRRMAKYIPSAETIAILCPDQRRSRSLAQRLGHTYSSIEPMEAPDLVEAARKIDASAGASRARLLIDFSGRCITKVSTELSAISKKLGSNYGVGFGKIRKHEQIRAVLSEVIKNGDAASMYNALSIMRAMGYMHRKDLYQGMQRALRLMSRSPGTTLEASVKASRQLTSITGRHSLTRVASYTLLLKGLEFDHALITEPTEMNRENLYVSLTRGARTLSVISSSKTLTPFQKTDIQKPMQRQLTFGI